MFETDSSEHFLSSRSVDRRLLPVLVVSIVDKAIEPRPGSSIRFRSVEENQSYWGCTCSGSPVGRGQSVYQQLRHYTQVIYYPGTSTCVLLISLSAYDLR